MITWRPGLAYAWQLVWAGILSCAICQVVAGAPADDDPELYRPQWNVGQEWVVETINLQTQARHSPQGKPPAAPVRWKFLVKKTAKVDQRECFEVQVTCLVGAVRPMTTLWVDRETMTLRRVQTQVPLAGGLRTVTESYRSTSKQPFPAFAPLTIPPLELPLFLQGTKGTQTFTYLATGDPAGVKGVGDVDFAFSVEQHVTQPAADEVNELLPQQYSKDLAKKPIVEVQLQAANSKVRQLWQPGVPWPVYSNNGVAESRLIRARRASAAMTGQNANSKVQSAKCKVNSESYAFPQWV